jgi:Ca2+-binding EF-hand superfamily protein
MRRLLLAAALALAPPALADEKPRRVDPSAAPEVQDIVFYGKARPVLIRLRLYVDGRPYTEAWENHIKKRFAYADRDGNGYLDRETIKLLPSAFAFQDMVVVRGAGPNYFNIQPPTMEDIDTNGDGKVTFAEVREYYLKSQGKVIQLVGVQVPGNGANAVTQALFRHFDRNKDGKISKEELAGAEKIIDRLDSNDDETLDVAELLGGPGMYQPGRVAQVAQPGMPAAAYYDTPFALVPREKEAKRLTERLKIARELIHRYDKDKSGKLTLEEIGLEKELFDKLDRNHDRVLDVAELLRYIVVAPDVEVTLHIGKRGREAGVRLTPGKRPNLASHLREASGGVTLSMTTAQIDLRPTESVAPNFQRSRLFAQQLFSQADPTNKGLVELNKLDKNPRLAAMRSLLEMADRDGDGKVTRKEFFELMELNNAAAACTTTVSVAEYGQGLFEMLDANRDGRLSVRELRTAWERLSAYDHNKDGALSKDEIPFQYQILVGAGAINPAQAQQRFNVYAQRRPVTTPTAGPLWFRKMDRNGDGDVSPREFLGTPEQFKQLDEDGDGYISLEEAMRAEARLRQKVKAGAKR